MDPKKLIELEVKFLKTLEEKGLLQNADYTESLPVISHELLIEMMSEPSSVNFNNSGELLYESSNGDIIVVDVDSTRFDTMQDELIKALPRPNFDLECGGIQSKQIEAVAIYKVCVLNCVFKGIYSDFIRDIDETYDYNRLKSPSGDMPFNDFLKSISEDATPLIRLLLSCLNVLVLSSRSGKKIEYTGIIGASDAAELDAVERQVALINKLHSEKVGLCKTKLDRLKLEDERSNSINKTLDVAEERIRLLYRIIHLTPDDVPSQISVSIKLTAQKFCRDNVEVFDNDVFQMNLYTRKWLKRGRDLFLKQMITEKLELFSEGNTDNLISKLGR